MSIATAPAATAAEPAARFRDLLAAEWLKFRALRSASWSLLISALVIVTLNASTAYEEVHYWQQQRMTPAAFIAQGVPLLTAFTTNAAVAMMVLLSAIASVAVTGEFSTGLIRTTFTAVPARRPVMAAKVCVITAVAAVVGAVTAAASFALTQAILSRRDIGVPVSHPGALRVIVASALLAPVSALIGVAAGSLIRHVAGAVAGSLVLVQVLPLMIRDGGHVTAVIAHALPFDAYNRLVAIPYPATRFPWTVTGAWTVLAAWALAAAVLSVIAIYRRDL